MSNPADSEKGVVNVAALAVLGFLVISFIAGSIAVVRQNFDLRERAAGLYPVGHECTSNLDCESGKCSDIIIGLTRICQAVIPSPTPTPVTQNRYACVNGQCVISPSGEYLSISECGQLCRFAVSPSPSPRTDCRADYEGKCIGTSYVCDQGTISNTTGCGATEKCVPKLAACSIPCIANGQVLGQGATCCAGPGNYYQKGGSYICGPAPVPSPSEIPCPGKCVQSTYVCNQQDIGQTGCSNGYKCVSDSAVCQAPAVCPNSCLNGCIANTSSTFTCLAYCSAGCTNGCTFTSPTGGECKAKEPYCDNPDKCAAGYTCSKTLSGGVCLQQTCTSAGWECFKKTQGDYRRLCQTTPIGLQPASEEYCPGGCSGGSCVVAPKSLGATCTVNSECGSNNCLAGVCSAPSGGKAQDSPAQGVGSCFGKPLNGTFCRQASSVDTSLITCTDGKVTYTTNCPYGCENNACKAYIPAPSPSPTPGKELFCRTSAETQNCLAQGYVCNSVKLCVPNLANNNQPAIISAGEICNNDAGCDCSPNPDRPLVLSHIGKFAVCASTVVADQNYTCYGQCLKDFGTPDIYSNTTCRTAGEQSYGGSCPTGFTCCSSLVNPVQTTAEQNCIKEYNRTHLYGSECFQTLKDLGMVTGNEPGRYVTQVVQGPLYDLSIRFEAAKYIVQNWASLTPQERGASLALILSPQFGPAAQACRTGIGDVLHPNGECIVQMGLTYVTVYPIIQGAFNLFNNIFDFGQPTTALTPATLRNPPATIDQAPITTGYGRKIGEGANGVTYLDETTGVLTKVVKKTQSDYGNRLIEDSMIRQSQFMEKNGGQNGVPAFKGYIYDDSRNIIGYKMEYVPGPNLREFYASGGRLTQEEVNQAIIDLKATQNGIGGPHGDLVNGDLVRGYQLNSGNVIVVTKPDGKHRLVFIDYTGSNYIYPMDAAVNELSRFKVGLLDYAQ